ncbi:hypothetical protein COZ40_02795 [Candidatus Roizmanbacteria bacterium CG_4_10_14_3_um_filter_39_13]|uniref:BrnT family toxin n=2 Tax=Candidatus Roizmaniibacteriota TaxID=1752723 RepID=A0A2M7LKE4_9BACT|nr:MAG: hypothetical protein COS52_00165 [Candidatus Roizmanbacteria bacterium CG03_land_8_20_14_0_80_39_12]PIX68537.1 MAG: hypothetical protein COZ40_02795 [Candidatus Roizmanbacteria bacterium CG_4_10_14_3_um_filter_39_13]
MMDLSKYTGFEWDKGNIDKSFKKHKISPNESEEIFLDESLLVQEDLSHSQQEQRFIAIGKTVSKKLLLTVFTIRNYKIRIISVRIADHKERRHYEKS